MTGLLHEKKSQLEIVAALDPRSEAIKVVLERQNEVSSATLLIGPEGNLSHPEYDAAIGSGYHPVCLGEIVFRVETANLYCLVVLNYEYAKLPAIQACVLLVREQNYNQQFYEEIFPVF